MSSTHAKLPHLFGLRRVVVTGLGLVTPLGVGVDRTWRRLLAGDSGVGQIDRFDPVNLQAKIAAQLPLGAAADEGFDAKEWAAPKDLKKMDAFILYALAAAHEAIQDAGWLPEDDEAKNRTGVLIGSAVGGLATIEAGGRLLETASARRLSPFFVPANLINLASGQIGIKYGFRGPTHAVVTACASGAHAIGDAARMIALDDADVMIAGGAEACICELGVAGFDAAKALSTAYNERPQTASRPWDQGRDGFVMGEGSGVLVLEAYEHAVARGATIYAEIVGYGLSGDAHHMVSPAPDGNGAARAMQAALKRAALAPEQIDYLNAHATSTPVGDVAELAGIKTVFGAHALGSMSISSTKSAIGHLCGASGSVEAIFSILALRDQIVPPTLNLHDPAPECAGMDMVPLLAKQRPVAYALSNSFGFGGTNASLIFERST